jgi:hypothetical protein
VTKSEQSDTERTLRAYFKDLDAALSELPRARREQLGREIREHVDHALAQQPPKSPAELRDLLDRVGLPADIAAAALDEEGQPVRRPMRAGIKLLIAGACLVAVAGLATGLTIALQSGPAPHAAAAAGRSGRAQRAATSPAATTPVAPRTSAPASSVPASSVHPSPAPASSAPVSSAADGSPRAVLAPATVPPASNECALQVTFDADGNASPLLCSDGGVNTIAWLHYDKGAVGGQPVTFSKVLGLGPFASPAQVYQAMCSDYQNVYGTRPITESAEQLAQAYYGWKFAGDSPLADFENLGCPAS